VHVKAEPEPPHQRRDKPRRDGGGSSGDKEKFLSQPMHPYVSGKDVASAAEGETFTPPCGCGSWGTPGYNPGPHATWDCPLRYIQRYGYCPGFLINGFRDPSQWLPDNTLTRAAKDEWVKLIRQHRLPLPREAAARAPQFHL
jgi:hypothetical protein